MGRLGRTVDLEERDSYRFNRKDAAFEAAKRRKTLTVKEFAELLADVNPRKIGEYDDVGNAIYFEEVSPVIQLIINWIEEQDLTPPEDDDDIPF